MNINFKKFQDVTRPEDYPDTRTSERVLIGRMTAKRYEKLRAIARSMTDRHPYGKGYRCGHDHDCCGCLLGTYAGLAIDHYMGGWRIRLQVTQSFNY